jgi:hypothetical protein
MLKAASGATYCNKPTSGRLHDYLLADEGVGLRADRRLWRRLRSGNLHGGQPGVLQYKCQQDLPARSLKLQRARPGAVASP